MTNIIGNTVVISDSAEVNSSCAAIIGFRSLLMNSTYTGQDESPDYPFSNCLDFRDNTQYSPLATSGSVVIEFNQSSVSDVDYIGIGIHNGITAGLSGKLEVQSDGVWYEVATLAPTGDNKTMIAYFDSISSLRQRLTLNFTSKLFIGNIYLGKAWVFDKTPNIGFTPGYTNSLDKLEGFNSETNQFMMGRVIDRGFGQRGQFDFISWADGDGSFNLQYVDYMNHVKSGKPVFMKWNKNLQQNFFGRAANPNSLQAPTYSTNTAGTFYFDYKGFV
ncbi:hypothetical protein OAA60_03505 [Porticoccaceae bacterium]|nr:hypothetical protein [Porticoccaceae bacterium]